MDAWKNQLFFGDNLEILRSGRIPVASVDLIYLDPPLKPPTKPMKEAVPADHYVSALFPDLRFPRLQILTIADLFAGRQLEYPRWVPPKTFKRAARRRKGPTDAEKQGELL